MKVCRFLFVSVFIVGVIRMSKGTCDDIHECMEKHDGNYDRDMIIAENFKIFWDRLCSYNNKKLLAGCIDKLTDENIENYNDINTHCEQVDEYYPVDLKHEYALEEYRETCSDKDKDALKEFKECFKKQEMKDKKSMCLECPKKAEQNKKCGTQAVSPKPSNSTKCPICQYMHCIRKVMGEVCSGKAVKIYDKSMKVLCCGSKIYIKLVVLVGLYIVSCLFAKM